jgi:SPX domain protein involved in polyphosphate accumulation
VSEIIERYEYKYLLPDRLVPAVREAAQAACHVDRYAGPDGTYLIRSLYFDTPELELYRANEREQHDRYKLRVRVYPGKESPAFLEVKRRVGDVIVKTRAIVPHASWAAVVAADAAALDALPAVARERAMPFVVRVHRHHAAPVLLVEYEREAYVSDIDGYARLTFDRRIHVQPKATLDLEADPSAWRSVDHVVRTKTIEPVCVLELKFERRPPRWMVDFVRHLELERRSFSKYCYGMGDELTPPELRAPRW